MDDMDICWGWPGWRVDNDGLKRSSATLPRIVPKDGKTPGCSTDRALLARLTISYRPKGHVPPAMGPLHLHLHPPHPPPSYFAPFLPFSTLSV